MINLLLSDKIMCGNQKQLVLILSLAQSQAVVISLGYSLDSRSELLTLPKLSVKAAKKNPGIKSPW